MKNEFTRLYPLSKTLRFSLIPVNETMENIQKDGILEEDEHRAESYRKVKRIIDEYHKAYIEEALSGFTFGECGRKGISPLEEFAEYYSMAVRSEAENKRYEILQTGLRKQIADKLTSGDKFKRIDKKELIKEDLNGFVNTDEERRLIAEFSDFTTYFTGFHENRRNMYSAEPKSTAIAYRLIHENLPRFLDNIKVFRQLAESDGSDIIGEISAVFAEYLNRHSIEEVFNVDFYRFLLTQSGIDSYNALIGGVVLENGVHLKGLNGYINEYNQIHDRSSRIPKFRQLYKQILSDRNAISWLPESFSSDEEVLEAIEKCYENLDVKILSGTQNEEKTLKRLLSDIGEYDISRIYVANDQQLSDISQDIFGRWSVIQDAVAASYVRENPQGKKESSEKFNERVRKYLRDRQVLSIAEIEQDLRDAGFSSVGFISRYFADAKGKISENESYSDIFDYVKECYEKVKDLLNTSYSSGKNLSQDKESVAGIKRLLDAVKDLQHFVKPLVVSSEISEKDERFYGEFTPFYDEFVHFTQLYNMVRNYMTRKPYSTEKIKLNFNNSTLLNGWDVNKERDNTAVILLQDGMYYLGIMSKKWNRIFEKDELPSSGKCFRKMVYKLLPGANKMLPKVFFSKSRISEFNPSDEILEIREKGSYKKGDGFSLHDCHAMIDFYKTSIERHDDWKNFKFRFSPTESYNDITEFYSEVEQQGYMMTFQDVSEEYVYRLVEEGKLYLFKIYNKDFSRFSKGKPNMHTIYWRMLFDERNLADVVYKLNGEAEVFFRKASLQYDRPTHPANIPVRNKNINNEKTESVFAYDLIKDKRYTVDHFEFHVPITMNFKSRGAERINELVNGYIRENEDINVIGIDRGERHLLYLVMIDRKGRIVPGMQFSLNTLDGTDYHQLLDVREGQRLEARRSWDTIEGIKNLKEGYLSKAIHTIAEAMVKYNAILVLEDLNFGFKRGRQKVEKQVYQKFERMLIEKLNYLVDKNEDPEAIGGALNAYQLTGKFESFQKLGKQSGFLFYVPAWNTSKIDPVSGFVNLFDTRYESIEKTKDFFSKFDAICYNKEKDWFEFTFDYGRFTNKAEGTRKVWTVCTAGDRIWTFRNPEKNGNWDNVELNLNSEFKRLFAHYGIDVMSDLQESVLSMSEKSFFYNDKAGKESPHGFLQLFSLMLQMRNSITGTETDYLVSPVPDENGICYDSRHSDDSMPKNADANGAYNIARKGLWVLEQIRNTSDKRPKLAISNRDWLKFAQEKSYEK